MSAINKHGETALDVARNWGDDFIYAIVYAKAASLPPPPEAKGIVVYVCHEWNVEHLCPLGIGELWECY